MCAEIDFMVSRQKCLHIRTVSVPNKRQAQPNAERRWLCVQILLHRIVWRPGGTVARQAIIHFHLLTVAGCPPIFGRSLSQPPDNHNP